MAEPDELLTVAEIAAELKMNQQTIRNWIFRPVVGVSLSTVGSSGRWVDLPSGGRAVPAVTH
jgi:hypothetical protein